MYKYENAQVVKESCVLSGHYTITVQIAIKAKIVCLLGFAFSQNAFKFTKRV